MKIAFFGTSQFGVPTLEEIHKHFGVELVITAPARPSKRGQKLQNTPIFETAESFHIPTLMPEKITEEFINQIKSVIFFQRPLKEQEKGYCSLEPKEKRINKDADLI